MRARSLYYSACRSARNASANDLPPPRPPPRNKSTSSGIVNARCWNSLSSIDVDAIIPFLSFDTLHKLRLLGNDPRLVFVQLRRAGERDVHLDRRLIGDG